MVLIGSIVVGTLVSVGFLSVRVFLGALSRAGRWLGRVCRGWSGLCFLFLCWFFEGLRECSDRAFIAWFLKGGPGVGFHVAVLCRVMYPLCVLRVRVL